MLQLLNDYDAAMLKLLSQHCNAKFCAQNTSIVSSIEMYKESLTLLNQALFVDQHCEFAREKSEIFHPDMKLLIHIRMTGFWR